MITLLLGRCKSPFKINSPPAGRRVDSALRASRLGAARLVFTRYARSFKGASRRNVNLQLMVNWLRLGFAFSPSQAIVFKIGRVGRRQRDYHSI